MDEHVDTVVVGSGFGGAVTAFRLAEAGREVVVLERGCAYPPGGFPRSPREMGRAFWDPEESLHGLFDVWSFGGFESLVSSGLGGGSLIYANVLLRKDEKWFVHADPLPGGGYETWPVTRADLDPHYDAVERMLTPSRYPVHAEPYSRTAKTLALRDAAERLGLDWELPPLAVSFAPRPGADPVVGATLDDAPYGNLHGVPRRTCNLAGACDIGCNEGAKNSLDHTYLSAAAHHGADLRTLCEVTGLAARDGGGYVVDYRDRRPDGEPLTRRITADRVVLGAGAYGTTCLLLRNRDGLPGLGPALGTRYCGNGDLLTFLVPGEQERIFDASRGPVITGTIRVGDGLDGDDGRGFYVQDGGYPDFVNWIVEPARAAQGLRTAAFVLDWLGRRLRPSEDPNMSDEVSRLIGDGSLSAGSLPLLGMGRDVPDGVMSLDRHGRLDVRWTPETSRDYFRRVQETMAALSETLGTTLRTNPLWFFRRVVTVHPLGGAPMGHDPSTGVCDGHGEVFGHPGLYVADGAAMPGPVGPNPSLTIAAHSDRVATGILSHGSRPPTASRRTRRSGLSFSETMSGRLALGSTDPASGEERGDPASVELTITIPDVEAFLADPDHRAPATGRVSCDALGGTFEVVGGSFNLFVPGPDPGARRMVYRLPFTTPDGARHTLVGVKHVSDDPGVDVWSDTTTLHCHLYGADTDSASLGAGVLRLGAADLAHQLTTFATTGPDGPAMLARFGRFFLGELWNVYVRPDG